MDLRFQVTQLYRNDGYWVKGTGFGLFWGVGGASAARHDTAGERKDKSGFATQFSSTGRCSGGGSGGWQ